MVSTQLMRSKKTQLRYSEELMSPLSQARAAYKPPLPPCFHAAAQIVLHSTPLSHSETPQARMLKLFPNIGTAPVWRVEQAAISKITRPMRVGVVLSGGQAAGGHTVIAGLYDALQAYHPKSILIGFLDGPSGLLSENRSLVVTEELLATYRNQGGFDLLGSGRTKIESPEQFASVKDRVLELQLEGLVIIGGDDSNTNAAFLAEFFVKEKVPCSVIGVPKTIDGDLRNHYVELSFGFDSACRTYSETIGNIARDARSAKKSYYFIKMMGRHASHVTLECALQTHPNMALISEELLAQGAKLSDVTKTLCDMICERSTRGKEYGVILIPEGMIESLSDCRTLIGELNTLLAKESDLSQIPAQLSEESHRCFTSLPIAVQNQLLLDRDPHGNIEVSRIETERLLISLVTKELAERRQRGEYSGKFSAQPFFCGYEGRSGFPTQLDCTYCYTLGWTAIALLEGRVTGCIAYVQGLKNDVSQWKPGGFPLVSMMGFEERKGEKKAVIRKALIDLKGPLFARFAAVRSRYALEDLYRYPGPIQFGITEDPTQSLPMTLQE